ncbi:CDP-glycerol glycerophosphotransferase family protein [Aquibacillus halophilus]|uniref:CDP-glycerol glycerophosphotransferase family protein n=1 Tax=Aquibacillus halophilus TaxID=930132 RepID=A0A6A8D9S7_9BACI|nr:CDP-glycerol glycerophosphotransferase family protein [Aquibacillus halophilus]MRH41296.1 CDP-glycerol glycerophosphotransferase family protein [Aquibacillus halophilus]
MGREILISIYLSFFHVFFSICNFLPQQNKTTFVASFGDNVFYTARALASTDTSEIVILKTTNCKIDFQAITEAKVITFKAMNPFNFLKSIYHLATAETVMVDNYFGFLSAVSFRSNVTCVQLWHAAGAIKKFGLLDPSVKYRSKRALKRFLEVYSRFHYVVVGSEKMASIFKKSFGLTNENILRTGIPRTDMFFDQQYKIETKNCLRKHIPITADKKVIMFAPTFRDEQLSMTSLPLNVEKMYKELSNDYVLLLRLHPAVKYTFKNEFPDFLIDVSSYPNINDLLLITDYLITDYSSIPFEFSLLQKPMIFLAYDFEEYTKTRGFWEDYKLDIPGPLVKNTTEVINTIQLDKFNMKKIKDYAAKWNQYSKGLSSENLVNTLYRKQSQHSIDKVK